MNTPKVYLDAHTGEMRCKGCGERKLLEVPAPMMDVVKDLRAFNELHEKCPEMQLPGEQQP